MKRKYIMVAVAILTTLMSFSVSYAGSYDGSYSGQRFVGKDAKNPEKCSPTDITGHVSGNSVELTLGYNGTLLRGQIGKSGQVTLKGTAPGGRYDYTFSGKANGKSIQGSWKTLPSDCKGTWSVRKK